MARQIIYTVAVILVVNNIVINAKAAPDRTGAIDSASEITEEGYFTVSPNNKEYQLTTSSDPQKYESATGDPDEEIQAPTTTPLPPPTGDSTGTTPKSIISNEVKPRLRGYPKYFPEEGLAHPPPVHKPIYYSRPQEDMVPEENNLNYYFTMENECAPLHPAGLCSVPVTDCPEEDGRNYDFVNWKRPYDDSYNGYFPIDEMCPLVDDYC